MLLYNIIGLYKIHIHTNLCLKMRHFDDWKMNISGPYTEVYIINLIKYFLQRIFDTNCIYIFTCFFLMLVIRSQRQGWRSWYFLAPLPHCSLQDEDLLQTSAVKVHPQFWILENKTKVLLFLTSLANNAFKK